MAIGSAIPPHKLCQMFEGKPAVFISHSEKFKDQVAIPLRNHIESRDMHAIIVSEMPMPEQASAEPDAKVDYYLDRSDMFVALLTPDDRLESGDFQTRHNITDEISRARTRPHLKARVQVFKTRDVTVHSNINPTYEQLDPDNVEAIFPLFDRQAVEWGVMADPPQRHASQTSAEGPIGPTEKAELSSNFKGDSATEQAAAAMSELQRSLLGSHADTLSTPSVARAHLAASAALAAVRSTALYGVHELYSLFRERDDLLLADRERSHLLRTAVARLTTDNAPCWYWYRNSTAEDIHQRFIDLAALDPDEAVRIMALQMLAHAPRPLSPKDLHHLVTLAVEDENSRIRNAGTALLVAHGDMAVARRLQQETKVQEIADAILAIRAADTPVKALRVLAEEPALWSEEIERRLLSNAGSLPATVLHKVLGSDSANLRLLALRILNKSGRLRKATAVSTLEDDPSIKVRLEALRASLRRRWKLEVTVVDAVLKEDDVDVYTREEMYWEYEHTHSPDDLRKSLKWIGGNGWAVYGSLMDQTFEDEAERLRADLETDFKDLRKAYRQEIELIIYRDVEREAQKVSDGTPPQDLVSNRVAERMADFFSDFDSLEVFTTRRFRLAALRILSRRGSPEDIRFARRFISDADRDILGECIGLVGRFGDSSDVDSLLEIATRLYGEHAQEAVRVAFSLASDVAELFERVLELDKPALTAIAIEGLADLDIESTFELILPILRNPNERIRRAAIGSLIKRLSRKQMRILMDAYPNEPGYFFYNVGVRLDRHLYAPGWLRAARSSLDAA
jgi:hypothetical protein